jgi:hypothetical protein
MHAEEIYKIMAHVDEGFPGYGPSFRGRFLVPVRQPHVVQRQPPVLTSESETQ